MRPQFLTTCLTPGGSRRHPSLFRLRMEVVTLKRTRMPLRDLIFDELPSTSDPSDIHLYFDCEWKLLRSKEPGCYSG
ncbi:hypothetical protein CDAR_533701 [Caerostris darwini]|uniref:Uncharacterized protein n=1 Tax=Caerostris darwini TaxID=1538125 RepID=A0AAV4S5Z2_9ARAC|nr:hypothetical protein CDAR_533701 [Caerostris darwini]